MIGGKIWHWSRWSHSFTAPCGLIADGKRMPWLGKSPQKNPIQRDRIKESPSASKSNSVACVDTHTTMLSGQLHIAFRFWPTDLQIKFEFGQLCDETIETTGPVVSRGTTNGSKVGNGDRHRWWLRFELNSSKRNRHPVVSTCSTDTQSTPHGKRSLFNYNVPSIEWPSNRDWRPNRIRSDPNHERNKRPPIVTTKPPTITGSIVSVDRVELKFVNFSQQKSASRTSTTIQTSISDQSAGLIEPASIVQQQLKPISTSSSPSRRSLPSLSFGICRSPRWNSSTHLDDGRLHRVVFTKRTKAHGRPRPVRTKTARSGSASI